MTDMANKPTRNPLVYDRLSFLDYDWDCPRLDTEWLLSTLFDASLLSTFKAADSFGGSFFALRARPLFALFITTPETIKPVAAGLSGPAAQ
jgi:hypothetical protein